MQGIKILLQALGRAWFIDPIAAQQYAPVIDNLFAKTDDIFEGTQLTAAPAAFSFALNSSADQLGSISDAPAGSIALINISGAVMKYDFCGAPGTQSIMAAINEVNQNPNFDAIVLQIDSPGGSADGTPQLASAIKNSSKPVVVYCNGMMASAAMWFGSAAAYRIASSSIDMIGSIGTMVSWKDMSAVQKSMGVKIHEVYATASTDKNGEFRAANADTPDYQPLIDNILDPTNEQFIAAVKSNIKNVNEQVFTGGIYLADKAKEMGLIDQIGTLNDAVNKAIQLSNKKIVNKMEQNQRFANVLAASGAESFEMLNEGIWLTEAQLEGIENALSQSVAAVESAQLTVNTVEGGLTELQSTLEARQTALEAAEARIAELEASIILPVGVNTSADPAGVATGFDKFKTSYDVEAEKLNALIEKK
jgi:protease-4